MPSVEFFLPIVPMAQKRDRIAVIQGMARSYKDPKQRVKEDNLRSLIYRELPGNVLWPLKTPIRLFIGVALPIPASTTKRVRKEILDGMVMHTKKPDIDNLAKHLKDVGNGVIWQDDRQIWELRAKKYYSDEPGWHIYVEWR